MIALSMKNRMWLRMSIAVFGGPIDSWQVRKTRHFELLEMPTASILNAGSYQAVVEEGERLSTTTYRAFWTNPNISSLLVLF